MTAAGLEASRGNRIAGCSNLKSGFDGVGIVSAAGIYSTDDLERRGTGGHVRGNRSTHHRGFRRRQFRIKQRFIGHLRVFVFMHAGPPSCPMEQERLVVATPARSGRLLKRQ